MRTLFAYFFLLLILWPSWRMGLVWAWFKANQPFIAKELCINRDRPELQCNGKCFLMTNMREVHRQGHDNFVGGLEDLLSKDLIYVFEACTFHVSTILSLIHRRTSFQYQSRLSLLNAMALLKPPAVLEV
jgi:hypothetical protein